LLKLDKITRLGTHNSFSFHQLKSHQQKPRNGTSRVPYLVVERPLPGRTERDKPRSLPRRRDGWLLGRTERDQPRSLPRRRDGPLRGGCPNTNASDPDHCSPAVEKATKEQVLSRSQKMKKMFHEKERIQEGEPTNV
jgi:hypothetical protein